MKRLIRDFILTLALLAASVINAEAQTYLMNALKPTEQKYFYPFTGTKPLSMVGAVDWHNGFVIGSSSFYGEVSFDLGGRYDKLSFVFGHEQEGIKPTTDVASWDPGVVTIMLDDQLVFDRKLNSYDLPEWVELNVKGGRKITFKTAVKQISAAFGEVALQTRRTVRENKFRGWRGRQRLQSGGRFGMADCDCRRKNHRRGGNPPEGHGEAVRL